MMLNRHFSQIRLHPSSIQYHLTTKSFKEALINLSRLRVRGVVAPGQRRTTQRRTTTHYHNPNYGQFRVAWWPNLHVFELWKETRTPRETHAGKKRTSKLHPERPQLAGRFKPGTKSGQGHSSSFTPILFHGALFDHRGKVLLEQVLLPLRSIVLIS